MAGLALLVAVINHGVDRAYLKQSCSQCGARSSVHGFYFYGIGGEYDRVIDVGPTSRFIQARMGAPCDHDWELFDGYWGDILNRAAGSGAGGPRYLFTQMMDRWGTADDLTLFELHAAEDPTFADRYIHAIRNPYDDASRHIVHELIDCLQSQIGVETP